MRPNKRISAARFRALWITVLEGCRRALPTRTRVFDRHFAILCNLFEALWIKTKCFLLPTE
jgi:hypothetical protein